LNVQNRTKLAAQIKKIMNEGKLVPDSLVNEVTGKRLDEHDPEYGYLLDGYPRSQGQADYLLKNYTVNGVILIEIPDSLAMDRALGRRQCNGCGRDCNVLFNKPKKEGICDSCGGVLVSRKDDNPEAVKTRLGEYHKQTEPLVDFFKAKGLLTAINGDQKVDLVFKEICQKLKL
jgi:adenylate kinase